MNELRAQEFHGRKVVDSRDVAEMVGRPHYDLMKSIRTYSDYLGGGEISASDFFIPSTYINAQNKEMPNYLITKKGCDMIANKLTGKKGVLFTAAYVSAFEDMQKALTTQPRNQIPEGVSLGGLARLLSITRRIMIDMGNSPAEIGAVAKGLCDTCGVPLHEAFPSQIPGQLCLFEGPRLGA